MMPNAALVALLAALCAAPAVAADCRWREPERTYRTGARWSCVSTFTVDGDTLQAHCEGQPGTISIRLRGVDADDRDQPRYEAARAELRRRTEDRALVVIPHHDSYRRVVADVVAGGTEVGRAMDAAGWSKADCPKR